MIEEQEKNTRRYWKKFIKAAKDAAKQHFDDAKEAWREYENRGAKSDGRTIPKHNSRPYPIYWSSVKTLEPAYYSRTPKLNIKRRFDIEDPVAMTASLVVERLSEYLIDSCDFDDVMASVVADYIHADKTTAQVIYDVDLVPERIQLTATATEEGEEVFLLPNGQIFEGDVLEDDNGYFAEGDSIPENQKIYPKALPFDHVIHTPDARCESDIKEKAFYFCMDKQEAENRFGPDITEKINWKTQKSKSDDEDEYSHPEDDNTESLGEYLEGWECYSRDTQKVYWYSEQYTEDFLDVQKDPYGLKDFFPCTKFVLGSPPREDLYPTPVFIHLRPTIEELHSASLRVSKLIRGIRRRCLVDGANPDLVYAINDAEAAEAVAVENLTQILEKGGLDSSVWYIPVQELVAAIGELNGIQEKFKNEFAEWFGTPDILRGTSDPIETAAAQQIKSSAAHDRFKYSKKQIASIARDLIEMMLDLALGVFTDEKITQIVGVQYMEEEHAARFPDALAMLRNDEERLIRVDVETDTMSFVDDLMNRQQMNEAVNTVTQGLERVAAMLQTSPEFASVGLEVLLLSLDQLAPGKEFEDSIKSAVENLIQQSQEPQEPPPDYERMKLELQSQKQQMDATLKQYELQQKSFDLQLKQQDQEVEKYKTIAELSIKQSESRIEETVQRFMMQIEAQRVEIEKYKAQVQGIETQMEEVRLAREVELNAQTAAMQAQAEVISQKPADLPQPPSVTIVNAGGVEHDDEGKEARIVIDEFGNKKLEIAEKIEE